MPTILEPRTPARSMMILTIPAQTKNLKHKQATKPYRHHKIALAKQQKRKTRTPQDFSKTSYQPNPIKGDFRSEAGMTYIKIHLNR